MTDINGKTSEVALEDALDEYAAAGPNRETLEKWIATYPQFQRELTDLTVIWLELKHIPPVVGMTDPADIELRAASILSQVLHSLQNAPSPPEIVPQSTEARVAAAPPLMVSLLEQAAKVKMDVKEIATRAQMSVAMVMSFHRGMVQAASVPREAFSALGEALELTREILYAYLEMSLQIGASQRFKAKQAPVLQRITFAELVERDPELSQAERDRWLSIVSAGEDDKRRK